MNVSTFLDYREVPYTKVNHSPTYTAQRLAQMVHCSGEMVAKSVLLAVDDGFVLAVLPATHQVDLARAQRFMGAEHVDLATERECGRHFRDCELGAMPPFGTHYGIRTMIDHALVAEESIMFGTNTHNEAIRMHTSDFLTLEDPLIATFSQHL